MKTCESLAASLVLVEKPRWDTSSTPDAEAGWLTSILTRPVPSATKTDSVAGWWTALCCPPKEYVLPPLGGARPPRRYVVRSSLVS
jgi:hypothetical protein